MSEQLQVQIAEWMGIHPWKYRFSYQHEEGWDTSLPYDSFEEAEADRVSDLYGAEHSKAVGRFLSCPDFTGDLNAIASAEAKLSERQFSDYLAHLSDVAISAGNLRVTCATALQRATALARVINQERE